MLNNGDDDNENVKLPTHSLFNTKKRTTLSQTGSKLLCTEDIG